MKYFNENDSVRLNKIIEADVIGERQKVLLPQGTEAAVVLVHGDASAPSAYEIEAYIVEKDCYALATVQPEDIS